MVDIAENKFGLRPGALSVVVLSYNRKEELLKNLPSLCGASRETGFDLVVVDNASTDGSRAVLEELAQKNPGLRVLLNEENLGVGKGRNVGLKTVNTEFAVCIDDDTTISSSDIEEIPELFKAHPEAGILSFRVRHSLTGQWQNDHGNVACDVSNFHGAGHAFRCELLIRLKYLDEYCTFGGEELDMSIRAHAAGYRTIYVPEIVVYHNSFSRPGPEGADRRERWVYNYTRVLFKHFPRAMAVLFTLRYLTGHLYYGCRKFGVLFGFRLFIAALKGSNDGMKIHALVPEGTVRYYKRSDLRPDFGNIPLIKKMISRLTRWNGTPVRSIG